MDQRGRQGESGSQTFVRYRLGDGPAMYGILQGDEVATTAGDPFAGGLTATGTAGRVGADGLTLLAPTMPGKIVAIGLNYLDHITGDAPGFAKPVTPIVFLKPPSSLVGSGAEIILPKGAENVEAEAELAIVIGQRARYVRAEDAYDVILGFACANDVSARDYQFSDNQWVRAKGFDTFSPVGPITTGIRADDVSITARLNGATVQDSRTSMLLFDVPILVAFVSRVMTLEPGDLIMTGTPAHPPKLAVGDEIEIAIEGLSPLTNRCVAETLPPGIAARAIDDFEA